MSASGHYTRGLSLRINDKAVSVESPPRVAALPPTLSIGSRRARLLTSSATLRSPQTCFRLPHCLGCFAACGFSRPPALRRADYRCQSADADRPPVRFPNPCRLRRHPLPGELPASRPVSPVIVLPLWFFVFIEGVVLMVVEVFNRKGSASMSVVLLFVVLYYMGDRQSTYLLYALLIPLGILKLFMIPA